MDPPPRSTMTSIPVRLLSPSSEHRYGHSTFSEFLSSCLLSLSLYNLPVEFGQMVMIIFFFTKTNPVPERQRKISKVIE